MHSHADGRIRVIHRGTDVSAFSPEAVAPERVEALDVAFVPVGGLQGPSSYLRDLDTMIAARGLDGVVRHVGHCPDMRAPFLTASVVTVPSTQPEAFGRSAVEAQAVGALVVVIDPGAVPETVLAPPKVPGDERTGWHVPPADGIALAKAIGAALLLDARERNARPTRARFTSSIISRSTGWSPRLSEILRHCSIVTKRLPRARRRGSTVSTG